MRGTSSPGLSVPMAEETSTSEPLLGAGTLPHLHTFQLPNDILRSRPPLLGQGSLSSHGGWEGETVMESSLCSRPWL